MLPLPDSFSTARRSAFSALVIKAFLRMVACCLHVTRNARWCSLYGTAHQPGGAGRRLGHTISYHRFDAAVFTCIHKQWRSSMRAHCTLSVQPVGSASDRSWAPGYCRLGGPVTPSAGTGPPVSSWIALVAAAAFAPSSGGALRAAAFACSDWAIRSCHTVSVACFKAAL